MATHVKELQELVRLNGACHTPYAGTHYNGTGSGGLVDKT